MIPIGAFLMRPVGGLVIGYIGDRWGRKRALVLSLFLMGEFCLHASSNLHHSEM